MFWCCPKSRWLHLLYAFKSIFSLPEEFEDTKGVIRIRKSKDRQQKKMDKHRSTKHPHKTKDRVTRTPLKTGMWGELRCSGRVSSSCTTRCTYRVNLATNPVISHEWGKDREVLMTNGIYTLSFYLFLLISILYSLMIFCLSPLWCFYCFL
jgi:hypothetical protein